MIIYLIIFWQSALDSSPRNPSPVVLNGEKGESINVTPTWIIPGLLYDWSWLWPSLWLVCFVFSQRIVTSAPYPQAPPPCSYHQGTLVLNLTPLYLPSLNRTLSASQRVHTDTHTHTHTHYRTHELKLRFISDFTRSLVIRCIWRTPAGLQWQSGEGKIHYEGHPGQLPAWEQLQPHPPPIVSNALILNKQWVLNLDTQPI